MILQGEDGKDFINIYSKGKTSIGQWLSNFAHTPFKCEHGIFASIESYWYWLGCEDDDLRNLYGWQAKTEGRKRDRLIDNFILQRTLCIPPIFPIWMFPYSAIKGR